VTDARQGRPLQPGGFSWYNSRWGLRETKVPSPATCPRNWRPSWRLTSEPVREYCVRPAIALHQRVRDELHRMDPEYAEVEIGVG